MAAGKRGTKNPPESAERAPETTATTGDVEKPAKKPAATKKAAGSKPAATSKPATPAKKANGAKSTGAGATGAGSKAASGKGSATKRDSKPDLRTDLREFASARPEGWSHDEWLGLLDSLRERGHNISDSESIGRELERERLSVTLERVPGLGPKKVEAVAARFGTLWSLRHASAEEIASVPSIPRNLADRIAETVRK